MKRIRFQHAALAVAAVAALTLTGCGQESETDLLASAKTYLEKKDHNSAVIQLKAALQSYPQSGEARYLLGKTMLENGGLRDAIVELEKARDLRYDDNLVLPPLARAMVAAGELKRLTELYGRTTLPDPKAGSELRAQLAIAYSALGSAEQAQAAVDQALRLDPTNATARTHEARLLLATGDTAGSLKLLDEVTRDAPGRRDAWLLKGNVLARSKRDLDGAIAAYRSALASDDRYVPAHSALIEAFLQKGDVAAMREQVAAMKKALPQSPDTRYYQAQLGFLEGQLKPSREAMQQLLKLAPQNVRFLALAGAIEFRDGALLVAETHLSKAVQLDPGHLPARRMLAQTYLRSGQPAKATQMLTPLVEGPRPDAEALALSAEAHLLQGDAGTAERLFSRAATVDPTNTRAQTALALTTIARGDLQGGVSRLEAASRNDPDTHPDLALISLHLRRGELDAALKAIDRLGAKSTDAALAPYLRGRVLEQKKDTAGARQSFEKALTVDAAYFPAAKSLADLDVAEGKPDRALQRYEAMLAKDARDFRATLAIADLKRRAGAKPYEITALLRGAIRSAPTEVAPRLLLLDHLLQQRDGKAAQTAAEEALVAIPDDPQLLDALGRAQLVAGNPQQAIASFGKAAAAQPAQAMPQVSLADAYLRAGDRPAAVQALRRALGIEPGLLVAQQRLVLLAMQDRRTDDALAIAREVQRQRPKARTGWDIESEIHASLQQWPQAVAAAQQAYDRDKRLESATRLHSMLGRAGRSAEAERLAASWERSHPDDIGFLSHLGATAIEAGQYALAEARLRQILAKRPDDVLTLNNMAWVLVKQSKPGAVAFAERANKMLPGSPAVMDTMALALAADKRLAEAIEVQRKVVKASPDVPQYRMSLARMLLQSGDAASARSELEALAKLGDKFDEHAEVEKLLKTL